MPSFPATQALIDNIASLPNLILADDPGAATHFQPSLANSLAQLAWRHGALIPVGATAAGLWYANRKKKQPLKKSVPAVQHKAAADVNEILAAIRHHLPKLRVPDTVAGLAAGGGAGLLWDAVLGPVRDEQGNKKPSQRLRRVLTGALAGAGLSNLAGDRLRRYVANTVFPTNYGRGDSKIRELTPGTRFDVTTGEELTGAGRQPIESKNVLSDIWRAAILDKPNYKIAPTWGAPNIRDHAFNARRELVRRSFGLPLDQDRKADPYFAKRPGGYYSLNENSPEYNTRLRALYGPPKNTFTSVSKSKFYPYHNHAKLLQSPLATLAALNSAKNYDEETINSDFALFGGSQINGVQQIPYKKLPDGTIAGTTLDRWDMTLDSKERKVFDEAWQAYRKGGIAGFKEWSGRPLTQRINKYMGPQTSNNVNVLKTLGARWAWDKLLVDENPWVQQKFQIVKTPNRSWGEWATSNQDSNFDYKNSPHRLQFLQDNNEPATPAMSYVNFKEWADSNPAPPTIPAPQSAAITTARQKASNFLADYKSQFQNLYGIDPRLPHDYPALRQLLIASAVGGGLGFGRGLLWPGYHEKLDAQGNIVAKKRRSPWLGALEGAAIGAGTSALSNYASQTLAQYNPEIDKVLHGVKDKVVGALPVDAIKRYEQVDLNKPLFDKITATV